jgi:hypothetical protein
MTNYVLHFVFILVHSSGLGIMYKKNLATLHTTYLKDFSYQSTFFHGDQ